MAHAKAVTAAVKAADQSASAARASALQQRLARAELARMESRHSVVASLPQVIACLLACLRHMHTRLQLPRVRLMLLFWTICTCRVSMHGVLVCCVG